MSQYYNEPGKIMEVEPQIRKYIEEDKEGVVALWEEIFGYDAPHNEPSLSVEKKISRDPDLFLVAVTHGKVIGTVMGGYDGHRGWVYSLAVDKQWVGQGIGTALMSEIEQRLQSLGCLKVNLQVISTNSEVVKFYEKRGYLVEERISMGKRLY